MKANKIKLDLLNCKCEYDVSVRGQRRLVRACIKHRNKQDKPLIYKGESSFSLVKDCEGNYV